MRKAYDLLFLFLYFSIYTPDVEFSKYSDGTGLAHLKLI